MTYVEVHPYITAYGPDAAKFLLWAIPTFQDYCLYINIIIMWNYL